MNYEDGYRFGQRARRWTTLVVHAYVLGEIFGRLLAHWRP